MCGQCCNCNPEKDLGCGLQDRPRGPHAHFRDADPDKGVVVTVCGGHVGATKLEHLEHAFELLMKLRQPVIERFRVQHKSYVADVEEQIHRTQKAVQYNVRASASHH